MKQADLNLQASQIFRCAAQYIRSFGWQVTGMGEDGGPRCSMGALQSSHNVYAWDKSLAKLMYSQLYDELGGLSLTEFNYKYCSGEKVAQLFDRVAAKIA